MLSKQDSVLGDSKSLGGSVFNGTRMIRVKSQFPGQEEDG